MAAPGPDDEAPRAIYPAQLRGAGRLTLLLTGGGAIPPPALPLVRSCLDPRPCPTILSSQPPAPAAEDATPPPPAAPRDRAVPACSRRQRPARPAGDPGAGAGRLRQDLAAGATAARAPGPRRRGGLAVRAAAGRPRRASCRAWRWRCAWAPGARPSATRCCSAAPPTEPRRRHRWLAEVAHSALDLVLIVDEADRLPRALARGPGLPAAQRAAQPALRRRRAHRLRAGDRRPGRLRQCLVIGPAQLRFTWTRRSSWCAAASATRWTRRGGAPARTGRGLAAGAATGAVGDGRRRPRGELPRTRPAAARCASSCGLLLGNLDPRTSTS